jgi:hypothetical protein
VDNFGSPTTADLLEDYKLRVAFAGDQVNRLQTQFQVMLTLESGVAAALVLSNTGSLSPGARWIALLELVLSVVWLMIGHAGRERAQDNRRDAEKAGQAWAQAANLGDSYEPVGQGQKGIRIAVLGPLALVLAWAILFVFLVAR